MHEEGERGDVERQALRLAGPVEEGLAEALQGTNGAGQVADLVLWNGDPLEATSAADQVWIAGRAIEMRSRQTELRERYLRRLQ